MWAPEDDSYEEDGPMQPYMTIEHPIVNSSSPPDYSRYGVYRYDTYGESSVLAGQQRRSFVDACDSLEEAQRMYPDAEWSGEDNTGYQEVHIPETPPAWFDPLAAGEHWGEEDAY